MGDFDRYWAIDEWGSHPDEGNDDLWTGTEPFRADETDARAFFKGFSPTEGSSTMYLVLVKLDAEKSNVGDPVAYRRNPGYRKTKDDLSDWNREIAMQAGMGGGCDAYNDAMGY